MFFVSFFALDFDPKLLTNVSCWDNLCDKLVQLIYISGAVFNILHSRVEVVSIYLVSSEHYRYLTSASSEAEPWRSFLWVSVD